jgi:hypothetical protein
MTLQLSWHTPWLPLLLLGCLRFSTASSEPYFAVGQGLKCASCHVSPSGGGMRNAFGNGWAQTVLPAHQLQLPVEDVWAGEVGRHLAIGGTVRTGYSFSDFPRAQAQSQFDLDEVRAYLGLNVIRDRLLVYVDQRVAPGSSTNLEAYARYTSANHNWHVRAGQMYLPYGWRLEDDSALVRQVTGINFATPDRGIELGLETETVSAQLAVTNGTAAGAEADRGKQVSLRAEHIRSRWRFGASLNYNDGDAGARQMQGLFAGLRTGPIAWLAEADYVADDSSAAGKRREWVGLLEGNWTVRRGHNLKMSAEYFEPDVDIAEDEQTRFSVVWEYSPIQFMQLRIGARVYEGIPQSELQNRRLYFVALNGFF